MADSLRAPTARTCERCGRQERWDDADGTWRIASPDGEPSVGDPYCVHEWDINGSFNPFPESAE